MESQILLSRSSILLNRTRANSRPFTSPYLRKLIAVFTALMHMRCCYSRYFLLELS